MNFRRWVIQDLNWCSTRTFPASWFRSIAINRNLVRRSNRQFRLIASPQTHLELINEIISGAETHFGVDQDKFRLMVGTGQIQFLPFRFTFALLSALGMEVSLPLPAGGSGPTTP